MAVSRPCRAAALALAPLFFAAAVHAQDREPETPAAQTPAVDRPVDRDEAAERTEARSLMEARAMAYFERGLTLLRRGDAAAGRDMLRRSLSIFPNVATRFNLGIALRRTGEVTESRHVFRALLAEPGLGERERADIRRELDTLERAIATLIVTAEPALPAAFEVDGFPAGDLEAGATLRVNVDPGSHSVSALAGALRGTSELEVAPGGVANAVLRLVPLDREQDSTTLMWGVALGAAGLLAGAAALIAAVLAAPSAEPIVDDHTGLVWIGTP